MIIKNGANYVGIERLKKKIGLSGDVYIYKNHYIENLATHKKLITESTAITIEQAYEERILWEAEQKRLKLEREAQYRLEHPNEFVEVN